MLPEQVRRVVMPVSLSEFRILSWSPEVCRIEALLTVLQGFERCLPIFGVQVGVLYDHLEQHPQQCWPLGA